MYFVPLEDWQKLGPTLQHAALHFGEEFLREMDDVKRLLDEIADRLRDNSEGPSRQG